MNYFKIMIAFFVVQLSVITLYAQNSRKTTKPIATKISLNDKTFAWQLKSDAVLPARTLYKELVLLSGNEVTISRFFTLVSTKILNNMNEKQYHIVDFYKPILKGKNLRLVQDRNPYNINFTIILNKGNEIIQLINKGDNSIYLPISNQRPPMTLVQ